MAPVSIGWGVVQDNLSTWCSSNFPRTCHGTCAADSEKLRSRADLRPSNRVLVSSEVWGKKYGKSSKVDFRFPGDWFIEQAPSKNRVRKFRSQSERHRNPERRISQFFPHTPSVKDHSSFGRFSFWAFIFSLSATPVGPCTSKFDILTSSWHCPIRTNSTHVLESGFGYWHQSWRKITGLSGNFHYKFLNSTLRCVSIWRIHKGEVWYSEVPWDSCRPNCMTQSSWFWAWE